jgi:hypothetical protein
MLRVPVAPAPNSKKIFPTSPTESQNPLRNAAKKPAIRATPDKE